MSQSLRKFACCLLFCFTALDARCRVSYSSSFGYATDLGSVRFLCSFRAVFRSVSFDRIKISCTYLLTINLAFWKKNTCSCFFCWMELPKWKPWSRKSSQAATMAQMVVSWLATETRTPFEADATCTTTTTTTVTSKWQGKRSTVEQDERESWKKDRKP